MDDLHARIAALETSHQALLELVVSITLALSHRDALFAPALSANLDKLLRSLPPPHPGSAAHTDAVLLELQALIPDLMRDALAARADRLKLNAQAKRAGRTLDHAEQPTHVAMPGQKL